MLHNDLHGLRRAPSLREAVLNDYQAMMPVAAERFSRAVLEQLVLSAADPTESNTPDFVHAILPQIMQLRAQYAQLDASERVAFSLHEEVSPEASHELHMLVREGRNLAGRLALDNLARIGVATLSIVSDCAQAF